MEKMNKNKKADGMVQKVILFILFLALLGVAMFAIMLIFKKVS